MSIRFNCDCGKPLNAPDGSAGRRGKCPACDRIFVVPTPAPLVPVDDGELYGFAEDSKPTPPRAVAPRPAATAPRPVETLTERARHLGQPVKKRTAPPPQPVGSTGRSYRYLFLLLALLPLLWSTVRPEPATSELDRIDNTIENHPEIQDKVLAFLHPESDDDQSYYKKPAEKKSFDEIRPELMRILPGDKCDGALLAYDTYAHWGMAFLSGAMFFGLILLLFPPGHTKISHLLITGAFTGTAGILLLLAFQWVAFHMIFLRGGGIVAVVVDFIWLIGQSYRMALGDHGFVVSAIGFTAGVGFCEETCKAIPLLWKVCLTGFVSWRSAMIWGLISGVGFGVSEGITYSHDFYNGFDGWQIYLVRFISCVALHGIWAAATGINIFRRQDHFGGEMGLVDWIQQLAITIIVPMVLHGMYDTLLKEDLDWAALLVAFASFGWLAYQVEMAKKLYDRPAGAVA